MSNMSEFFSKIKENYEPLSAEKQIELLKEYKKTQNEALIEELVLSNIGLVYDRASPYIHYSFYDDLVMEGILGLLKSIEKFNPEKYKNKFSTYAVYWIDSYIGAYIRNNKNPIRLPQNVQNKEKTIKNYIQTFQEEHERSPSVQEIMKALDIENNKTNYKNILFLSQYDTPLSLNSEIKSDNNHTEFGELIENQNINIEEEITKKEEKEYLVKILSEKLTEREERIIRKHFGIGEPALSVEQIGKELGVTKQRVSQIEKGALRKLRKDKKIREYFLMK